MKNESCTTIVNAHRNGWTQVKHRNSARNGTSIRRSLWWLFGGPLPVLFITALWNLALRLRQMSTARNCKPWWRSLQLNNRDWSIALLPSCCMTTRDHILHKRPCQNCKSCSWKLSVTHRIPQTLHQQITNSFGIWTTFYRGKNSIRKRLSKVPSVTSSLRVHQASTAAA